MKKSKSAKPEKDLKDNTIGLSEVKGIVNQARKILPTDKAVEKSQLKKGFKWITLGKTSKLVSPKNIQSHLDEGWKINKRIIE